MSAEYDTGFALGTTLRFTLLPSTRVDDVDTPWVLTGLVFTLSIQGDDEDRALEVVSGRVVVELTPAETATYASNRDYPYHVNVAYPSGDVTEVLRGVLTTRGWVNEDES